MFDKATAGEKQKKEVRDRRRAQSSNVQEPSWETIKLYQCFGLVKATSARLTKLVCNTQIWPI